MPKRGKIGAIDRRERDRRSQIRKAFYKAVKARDTRLFWGIMHDFEIPSEEAVKHYEQFRVLIGEVWKHDP